MQFDAAKEKKTIDQYEMRYQGSSPVLRKYLFGGTYYSVHYLREHKLFSRKLIILAQFAINLPPAV